jgi:hypothetical protein
MRKKRAENVELGDDVYIERSTLSAVSVQNGYTTQDALLHVFIREVEEELALNNTRIINDYGGTAELKRRY